MLLVRVSRCNRPVRWTVFPSAIAGLRTTAGHFAAAKAGAARVRKAMVPVVVLGAPAAGRRARASLRKANLASVDLSGRIR